MIKVVDSKITQISGSTFPKVIFQLKLIFHTLESIESAQMTLILQFDYRSVAGAFAGMAHKQFTRREINVSR
ncbi:MAG: hypothetical protein IPN57_05185 [Ignavibacteria bacterium]|nr:hypothetical protein [Ignavibacteria bacterium]